MLMGDAAISRFSHDFWKLYDWKLSREILWVRQVFFFLLGSPSAAKMSYGHSLLGRRLQNCILAKCFALYTLYSCHSWQGVKEIAREKKLERPPWRWRLHRLSLRKTCTYNARCTWGWQFHPLSNELLQHLDVDQANRSTMSERLACWAVLVASRFALVCVRTGWHRCLEPLKNCPTHWR